MNNSSTNDINNISFNTSNNVGTSLLTDAELSDIYSESILQILDEPFDLQIDRSKLRQDEEFFGFDNNSGDAWIYPKNFPIRAYQYNISKVALFRNTLVALPTGLGKTFIAAVVMYNIYRWYPLGKIIFMAPTRPLVSQQIEACYKVMGIPKRDTVELTGKQSKTVRAQLWQSKRVFFATPQTVQSDISSNPNFPFKQVRLIVVDEAHKAKGKYAYTEVVQTISNRNRWFRVLALSATPGRHIEDVVEVIRNLQIAHVEIRWENSIDVSPYTFKKNIKTELVPLDQNLRNIKNDFVLIIDKYVRKLLVYDVLCGSTGSLSRNSLLIQQKRFRENSMHNHHPNHSDIISYFSVTISLFHALDLLERHGIRSFLTFFEDDTNCTGEKYFVSKDQELKMLVSNLKRQYNHILVDEQQIALPNGLSLARENVNDYGHPKFLILKKCLLDFFKNHGESRAIVFCEYRETVLLVYRMLLNCDPIRAKFIVGKGSSIGIKAVTEKQQKNVMAKFREGVFNTLIATCVAEEGIDIGEVGLIVCFDTSTRNPTRFIQRMGRTGRQRQGSVVMLVTEGSEFDNLKDILSNKDKTNQKIVRSGEILKNLYKGSSRLVPPEFDPKCLEVFIKNGVENTEPVNTESNLNTSASIGRVPKTPITKKSKSKPKPIGMRDMREYFKRADLSEQELDVFSSPHPPPPQAPEITSSTAVAMAEPRVQPKMKTRNRLLKNLVDDQKALNRATDLNVCKLKSNFNFQSTLNDKNLDNRIKMLFVKSNLAYLESKVESLNIVDALNVTDDRDDEDCIMIEPEFEKLRVEIQMLKNLFDYPTFFEAAKNYDNFLKIQPKFNKNFNLSFINLSYFNSVTNDLEKLRYELFSKQIGKFLNETEIDNSIMDITHEWEVDFHKSIKKKVASSPTPSTSRNIPTKELTLVDEFLTLSYFKLNDFDEIFQNDSIEKISKRQPRRLLFDTEALDYEDDGDVTEIFSPIPPFAENNRDENIEVTVDKILEMFDTPKQTEMSNSKKFDLGDADNLFCSDDDDLFADCDDGIAVQQDEEEEEDEQKTQEYLLRNIEKSTDIFETTICPIPKSNEVPSVSQNQNIIVSSPNFTSNPHLENNISLADIMSNDVPSVSQRPINFASPPKSNPDPENNISQSDVMTQLNPGFQLNHENLLDMETQINPAFAIQSNIFEQETQPFQKSYEQLFNQDTEINPECSRRSSTPSNIFKLQTQKFTERSPSALFNRGRSKINISHNKNTSVIEFSQIPASKIRNRKRVIDSSDDSTKSISEPDSPIRVRPAPARKRIKHCEFIDDEAVCDDEMENPHEEFTQTQSQFINSLINDDFTEHEHNTSVDMHQVYLKSVKSPGRNGNFIMRQPRITEYSNIFSQMPEQDDDYFDKEDSFVVDDNEVAIHENHRAQSNDECPLERAERILKEQRRKKKRRKRQILILSDDSSDSSESVDSVIMVR